MGKTELKVRTSTTPQKGKTVLEGLLSVSKYSSETFLKITRVHMILDSMLILLLKLQICLQSTEELDI